MKVDGKFNIRWPCGMEIGIEGKGQGLLMSGEINFNANDEGKGGIENDYSCPLHGKECPPNIGGIKQG